MRPLPSLRQVREDKALSQRDLATRAGTSPGTVGQIERGERKARPRTTRRLADALGVEPIQLMKGA